MVKVDQSKCIGCGLCASTCPAVFAIDSETQKSSVLPNADLSASCIKDAVESCPAGAISTN